MEPGSQLGSYVVRRQVAQGGFGSVWEAELVGPASYRKRVALKVLSGSGSLRREQRLAGLLGHRNVVEVVEVGAASGRSFLALEWVDGPSLQELLRAGPLPPRAVVELGCCIAAALAHAHGRGVVHRDVSPANVLLTSEGEPKLSDLGLATFAGEHARRAGTPGYVSPEQSRGEPVDGRSDVWSLGAVLARAATGRHLVGRRVPVDLVELASARAGVANGLAGYPPLGELVSALTEADAGSRPDAAEAAAWLRRLSLGQTGARGTARELPPGRTLRQCVGGAPREAAVRRLGNAVPPADPFFGREAERHELTARIGSGGPVTVHGPGGMGKTRLVLEVATELEPAGGVWFVDLSAAHRVEEVCAVVATALAVPLGRADPVVTLGAALAGRPPLLLVLDNAEQAVEAVASVVAAWSRRAPSASLVVTSRAVLGVSGERVVSLGPLGAAAQRALFEARAVARGWTGVAGEQLSALLARVDGVPLAVELAAVQAAEVGVDAALALLSSPEGETPGLHPAMSAALHGSWALLDEHERSALAQLTVFEGGFTTESVDAVLDLPDAAPWSLDLLEALHDKAIVHSRAGESGPRFGLYVPVQQFASARLVGAARVAAEQRHGQHLSQFGARLERVRLGEPAAVRELLVERANLTVALSRALVRSDGLVVAQVAEALWCGYELTGPIGDGVSVLERALAARDLPPLARARLLGLSGRAQWFDGQLDDALLVLEQAREQCVALRCRAEEGAVLASLARVRLQKGLRAEAEAAYTAALAAHREVGDRRLEGTALGNLGMLLQVQGRAREAEAHHQDALAVHQQVGDRRGESVTRTNLAILLMTEGRVADAHAHYEAALAVHRELGDRRLEGIVVGNLGLVHLALGQLAEAEACYRASLAIHRDVGNPRSEAIVLGNLGTLHNDLGRLGEAASLCDQALSLHRQLGDRRGVGVALTNLGLVRHRQGRLEEAQADLEGALAVHEEVENRPHLATALGLLGHLCLDQGRTERSLELLHRALDLSRELHAGTLEGTMQTGLARVALQLGDPDAARAALDEGERLLRATRAPIELGLALCLRAELFLLDGGGDGARLALAEARRCATARGAGPESELGLELARVGRLVESSARPPDASGGS